MRRIHPETWIRMLRRTIDYIEKRKTTLIVISDVRFQNEAAAILDWGGEVWMVTGRENPAVDTSHESEQQFSRIKRHREIDNSGSITELYERLDGIMKDLEIKAVKAIVEETVEETGEKS